MSDDLLEQFLIEGRELTAQAGDDLAALARAPDDRARLDRCFRAVHTLKGSTGLFDLPAMGRLLHAAEDQLGAVRQGRALEADLVSALVETVDQADRWLDDLERTGALPANAGAVSDRLIARLSPTGSISAASQFGVAIRYTPRADAYFAGDDPVAIMAAVPQLRDIKVWLREPADDLAEYDPFQCNLVIEAASTAPRAEVEAALRWVKDQVALSPLAAPSAAPAEAEAGEGEGVGRTIRVEAARVDRLADITSDLVIAKNGLGDLVAQVESLADGHALAQALRAQQARIERLVADLHGVVGKVRLTPLAPLFGRFPRLVRQTARALGKTVDFTCEGGEIEVDKAIVDGLFEPLLHVLRNALDHGLEAPDLRRAAGKPEAGVLRLAARIEGEQVVIEISDDGDGVDPARVRDLAVARGLIDAATARTLDDRQAVELIFLPGFSTAGSVTEVSGRGVGMDAVRAAAAGLGGRVDIESTLGQGSTVRLLLPVGMVLTKVLVVACGAERYGLALSEVAETVRVSADRISAVRGGEAFQLRDEVLPLVRLDALIDCPGQHDPGEARRVVVARVGEERVGFCVDAIVGRMDAAVRPMSGLLAGARGVVGSTLLADGAVLMILDLAELVS